MKIKTTKASFGYTVEIAGKWVKYNIELESDGDCATELFQLCKEKITEQVEGDRKKKETPQYPKETEFGSSVRTASSMLQVSA